MPAPPPRFSACDHAPWSPARIREGGIATVSSLDQQVIVIEPANPQIVDVPQYDSQVVYTLSATSQRVRSLWRSGRGASLQSAD